MRLLALLLLSGFLAGPGSAQSGTIDQSSPMVTSLFNVDSPGLIWQQQVTAGADGLLEGIRLEVRASSPASVVIRIRPGIAWSNQPAVWSGTLSASGLGQTIWESIFVDCSSGGLVLAAGEDFVFEIEGAIPGLLLRGNYCQLPGVPQYSAPLYLGQSPYSSCYRMGFDTYMLPATPSLAVIGACPGTAQLTLERMTPGGPVVIASAVATGSGVVAGGACAGTVIELLNPAIRWIGTADASGKVTISNVNLPAVACGLVHAQGFDVVSCQPTNRVAL